MQIQTNVSLKSYSTMRLGGTAQALVTVTTKAELLEALAWAKSKNLPTLMLGGGSNVIFSDGYAGLVIVNRLAGFDILSQDTHSATLRIGAGENWDTVVARTVEMHLHGIELLSAIPGTAGATPVQNVGAYGAEIADTFVELEAYDMQTQKFVTLSKKDCQFSYRHSQFKSPDNRRYIITSITLRVTKQMPQPPFYASLQQYLDEHAITEYTPQTIRQAVIAVRAVRLPDPAKVGSAGSFFKNPVVSADQAAALATQYPTIVHWPLKDGRVKLAAGWLIEHAGLRNYRAHGMRTYEHHALVLINETAQTYSDLLAFKNEIIDKVNIKFGVKLQQEPELI